MALARDGQVSCIRCGGPLEKGQKGACAQCEADELARLPKTVATKVLGGVEPDAFLFCHAKVETAESFNRDIVSALFAGAIAGATGGSTVFSQSNYKGVAKTYLLASKGTDNYVVCFGDIPYEFTDAPLSDWHLRVFSEMTSTPQQTITTNRYAPGSVRIVATSSQTLTVSPSGTQETELTVSSYSPTPSTLAVQNRLGDHSTRAGLWDKADLHDLLLAMQGMQGARPAADLLLLIADGSAASDELTKLSTAPEYMNALANAFTGSKADVKGKVLNKLPQLPESFRRAFSDALSHLYARQRGCSMQALACTLCGFLLALYVTIGNWEEKGHMVGLLLTITIICGLLTILFGIMLSRSSNQLKRWRQ